MKWNHRFSVVNRRVPGDIIEQQCTLPVWSVDGFSGSTIVRQVAARELFWPRGQPSTIHEINVRRQCRWQRKNSGYAVHQKTNAANQSSSGKFASMSVKGAKNIQKARNRRVTSQWGWICFAENNFTAWTETKGVFRINRTCARFTWVFPDLGKCDASVGLVWYCSTDHFEKIFWALSKLR